ncbi:MAG: MAPEG family protein [Polyangiaceae bacterium]|nr:MAPEG family protein [Polyangiaceae bacterium]
MFNLNLMSIEAFRIYALCASVLALNLLVLSGMVGGARARTKSFSNPEDAKDKTAPPDATEHPDVARINRAHRNALENIPIFWAIGFIYVLAGASATGAKAYFITFTAARIIHSIVHIKALQPWRSISYGIGSLCIAGMIVQIGIAAFR